MEPADRDDRGRARASALYGGAWCQDTILPAGTDGEEYPINAFRYGLSRCLGGVRCRPPESDDFSSEPYVEDLEQLAKVTATTYANFEWAIIEGDIHPVAVYAEAQETILTAESDEAAREALEGSFDRFGDSHFRLREPSAERRRGQSSAAGPGRDSPAEEACSNSDTRHTISLSVSISARGSSSYQHSTTPSQPAGSERTDGTRIGVVRTDESAPIASVSTVPRLGSLPARTEEPCVDWPCEYAFRVASGRNICSTKSPTDRQARRGKNRRAGGRHYRQWRRHRLDRPDSTNATGKPRPATNSQSCGIRTGRGSSRRWPPRSKPISPGTACRMLSAGSWNSVVTARGPASCRPASGRDLSDTWERGANALPCSLLVRGVLYTTGLTPKPPGIAIEGLGERHEPFQELRLP